MLPTSLGMHDLHPWAGTDLLLSFGIRIGGCGIRTGTERRNGQLPHGRIR
jgi:hypothetical protein